MVSCCSGRRRCAVREPVDTAKAKSACQGSSSAEVRVLLSGRRTAGAALKNWREPTICRAQAHGQIWVWQVSVYRAL